jgi:hypothetical protein
MANDLVATPPAANDAAGTALVGQWWRPRRRDEVPRAGKRLTSLVGLAATLMRAERDGDRLVASKSQRHGASPGEPRSPEVAER